MARRPAPLPPKGPSLTSDQARTNLEKALQTGCKLLERQPLEALIDDLPTAAADQPNTPADDAVSA